MDGTVRTYLEDADPIILRSPVICRWRGYRPHRGVFYVPHEVAHVRHVCTPEGGNPDWNRTECWNEVFWDRDRNRTSDSSPRDEGGTASSAYGSMWKEKLAAHTQRKTSSRIYGTIIYPQPLFNVIKPGHVPRGKKGNNVSEDSPVCWLSRSRVVALCAWVKALYHHWKPSQHARVGDDRIPFRLDVCSPHK